MADIAFQASPASQRAPASRPENELAALLPATLQDDRLATVRAFPAYRKARELLEGLICGLKLNRIADIGGGANPTIEPEFIAWSGIRYDVLDISAEELAKASDSYSKVVVDLCAPADEFARQVEGGAYDLVFTHMFLEHIPNPEIVHRNIRWMLKPGGLAVHVFPSSANLPLTVNKWVPASLALALLRFVRPRRDFQGNESWHRSYYKHCGAPSRRTRDAFDRYGFDVLRHKGFVGHSYYSRFPIVRGIEVALRKPLAALGIPLVSGVLLIVRRR
jgi:SAM-dependent methyltransferase